MNRFEKGDKVKVTQTEFYKESHRALTGATGVIVGKSVMLDEDLQGPPKSPIYYIVNFYPPIGPDRIDDYPFSADELELEGETK